MESVRTQDYSVEHIIRDGVSTDGTMQIARQYRSDRCKIFSKEDNGIYDAMNKGITCASGDVIGFLNADDFYTDNTVISRIARTFKKLHVDSCYGDLVYVDSKNPESVIRYWHSGRYTPQSFYCGWMPPHPTFFARRSIYNKFGLYNLSLGTAADYELMLRFLLKFKIKAAYIPEVLVKMRIGGKSNASLRDRIRANRNDRLAWEINGLKPYPWTITLKPARKFFQYIRRPPS